MEWVKRLHVLQYLKRGTQGSRKARSRRSIRRDIPFTDHFAPSHGFGCDKGGKLFR